MRVSILSQYFTPEITAASARIHAFAAYLAERGADVRVICEVPNHPSGVIEADYRGHLFQRREMSGFTVDYVWVAASPSKRARARIAAYGSYAATASARAAGGARPDVIFASSPPLPVGLAGLLTATLRRVPWVLDVRDLWPEVAVALGELRGDGAIAVARGIERRLYRSAAAVTTPTAPGRVHIAEICGDPDKVHLISSGTTPAWLEVGESVVERDVLGGDPSVFTWTYAGNLGIAQDIETAVDAAGLLGEGFRLLLIGDGPLRQRAERRAEALAAGAVEFTGLLPRERAAELMRASDALLVSLADSPGVAYAVPSKLYDCCAIGRPVIVAAAGEAARLAKDEEIAALAKPGDAAALADVVRDLRRRPEWGRELSARGRAFAAANLREHHAAKLELLLRGVARRRA